MNKLKYIIIAGVNGSRESTLYDTSSGLIKSQRI